MLRKSIPARRLEEGTHPTSAAHLQRRPDIHPDDDNALLEFIGEYDEQEIGDGDRQNDGTPKSLDRVIK